MRNRIRSFTWLRPFRYPRMGAFGTFMSLLTKFQNWFLKTGAANLTGVWIDETAWVPSAFMALGFADLGGVWDDLRTFLALVSNGIIDIGDAGRLLDADGSMITEG